MKNSEQSNGMSFDSVVCCAILPTPIAPEEDVSIDHNYQELYQSSFEMQDFIFLKVLQQK